MGAVSAGHGDGIAEIMTEDRIISSANDLYWTRITAVLDWSEFYDEAAICAATGFPTGTRGHHIYCSFWQGSADPDDVCSVKLASDGGISYADFDDAECEFGSGPDAGGYVYLTGCFVKAA